MKIELTKFNQYLLEFIEDLKYICNKEELTKFKKGLTFIKYNSSIAIRLFKLNIADNELYRYMIMEENEMFFLNHDFNNNQISNISNFSNIINDIKHKWISLNTTEKNNIWKYLKILLYYCDLSNKIDTKKYHLLLKNKFMRCYN